MDDEPGALDSTFYLSRLDPSHNYLTASTVNIPLKEDNGLVTIDTNSELPDDPVEFCVLLENESASPEIWMAIARAYAVQGKIEDGLEVVKRGLNSDVIFNSPNKVKAAFHNFSHWLYMRKANKCLSKEETTDCERNGAESLEMALKLDPENVNNLLTKALSVLNSADSKHSVDSAADIIDKLLKVDNSNQLALVAKAQVAFKRQNYSVALKLLQKSLTLNPLLLPDPRIGIGLCFWFLKNKKLAQLAWQNSLKVNPQKLDAKILLCVAKMDDTFLNSLSDTEFIANYQQSLELIKNCYLENASSPVLLLLLSSYYFSRKDFATVKKLCQRVLDTVSASSVVKSSAKFWVGRVFLEENQLSEASINFLDSIRFNKDNNLSKFALAQVQILRNDANEAIITLEKLLKEEGKLIETHYVLGVLYSRSPKNYFKAITYLEKYLQLCEEQREPPIQDALLILSQVYEHKDLNKSLKYLDQVKQMIFSHTNTTSLDSLPYSLLNNLGVFTLLKSDVSSTNSLVPKDYFDLAVKSLEQTNPPNSAQLGITLKYNQARTEETVGNVKEAQVLYESILKDCPSYKSAKIRLLFLSCVNSSDSVKDELESLLKDNPDDLEIRSFYGWYLHNFGRVHGYRQESMSEHHKQTLNSVSNRDCYALISLANVYLSIAREVKNDVKKQNSYYARAAQLFQKVLTFDSKNVYAAQGVAIIFAERRQHGIALEIFRKIRDSLHDISIYINLGHCLSEVRQYAKAVECYQIALQKFTLGGKSEAKVLVLLGKVWYVRGVHEGSLEFLKKSLEIASKAYQLNKIPSLLFNIAFIQFQMADLIRRLPETSKSVDDIEFCSAGLEDAILTLTKMANEPNPPHPPQELMARVTMGQNTLRKQLDAVLQQQKDFAFSVEERLEKAKKVQEEEKLKLLEQQQRRLDEAKKKEEIMLQERLKLQQDDEEYRKRRIEEVDENPPASGSEDEGKRKRNSKKKAKRSKKVSDSESEDEAAHNGSKKKGLSDEEEEELPKEESDAEVDDLFE